MNNTTERRNREQIREDIAQAESVVERLEFDYNQTPEDHEEEREDIVQRLVTFEKIIAKYSEELRTTYV